MMIHPQQFYPAQLPETAPILRAKVIILSVVISLSSVVGTTAWVRPAIACEYPDWVEPSRETRRYENAQLGLAFQIPGNYRVMGRQDGGVSIINPSNYAYIQCIIRTGNGEGGWFSSLELGLDNVPAGSRGLEQVIREASPWIESQIRLVNQNGKEVAVYSVVDAHDDIQVMNVAFFTDDRRRIVTLSGPQDDAVFQQAIATLELR